MTIYSKIKFIAFPILIFWLSSSVLAKKNCGGCKVRFLFQIAIFVLGLTNAYALDDATELAKKSQNPVEKMVTIPFDSNFNFGYGPHQNTQYILNIKPVIPFALSDQWNLISRTIIPMQHQPNLFFNRDYMNGLGDINPSFFLSPANPGAILWGIGPTLVLPTATERQMGEGKYSLGPTFVLLTMPGRWVIGFLTYNVWSIGGQSNRPHVNSFEFQYFINYNMPQGWYLTTNSINTANWYAASNDRWTIPLGFGAGHVFTVYKQPVNVSLQAYNNLKSPQTTGANWQAQLNISLLFPEDY